jgi:uncharacterized protein DUF6600
MTNLRRFVALSFLLVLCVSVAALSAFADADPPGRAVRIKYLSGPVSIQPGGVNDWAEAVVNRPLTTSDRVWTDKDARAELHLGSAALRMNAETSLTLTNVNDDMVQIELDQGTLNLHIRHLFGGETYEIDTPNQAFTILKAGDYRFDVDPNADTTSIAVWRGEGEANGQGPGVKIKSGRQATFSGGTSLEHQMASAPDFDGFDDWCRVRDQREDHARSYEYVSADVVGADDLDEYGTWRVVGSYGPVWVPTVAPGWAPYHDGHWVWVEPWGWTWVDDAPWGFAPSHYGRWVHLGGYWGWAPGPVVVARPVYAPALVAWVGGPHLSVSVSFGGGGGVAWFPLGWGEPYVPSYHASRTYFQQVNVTNTHITNITNVTNNYYVSNNTTVVNNTHVQNIHYVNQNVAGAVTAVPTRALTNSESVSRTAVTVPAGELRTAAVVNAAPVAPARTSVLGLKAGAPAVVPPARAIAARPVVSRAAPPARPIPFEAKQEALAKTPGRPLDAQTESQLRSNMARPAPMRGAQQLETQGPRAGTPGGTPAPAGTNIPGRTGMPAAANVPGRPGSVVATTPRVGEPAANAPANNAESHPTFGNSQPAATTSGRAVPRPPQPGMNRSSGITSSPADAGRPQVPIAAPMARPVPRPPQTERGQNGEVVSPARPSAPQQPEQAGRVASPANPAQPLRGPVPNSTITPRSGQNEQAPNPQAAAPARPAPAQPIDSNRADAPSRPVQSPRVQPTANSAPVAPRPVPSPSRPAVQPAVRESSPRPDSRPQPVPRQETRPQVQSRPQQQEQHSAPKNAEPKHEDKGHNNSR